LDFAVEMEKLREDDKTPTQEHVLKGDGGKEIGMGDVRLRKVGRARAKSF